MAHHHKRHHHRRRHRNPMSYHRRHHRHRNPFFETGELSTIMWGTVGAVGARAIPAMVLSSKNSGLMGYGLNLASAFALKFVGNMTVGKNAGSEMFIGGAISTLLRAVTDNLGAKIKGLSGDPQFRLGAYWQSYFAVPTVSDPYGRVAASPYPQPVAALPPAGGKAAGGMGRFASRYNVR